MKNLIEISKIVTKKKVRKIEIFDSATLDNTTSKFSEFYEALMAGRFRNDRDAATYLYRCSPSHDKYRQLKSRFKRRLLNTMFFIDINKPGASNYDRAYFTCNKEWTLVKILLSYDANLTARDIAKSILTTALKFKFADVIVNCSRILRRFAAEANDEKDFELYDGYVREYANILEAEMRSEELFQRVLIKYRKPASEIESLKEILYECCNELVSLSERYESPVVNYNMYLVWTYRYEMQQDYPAMIEVCQRAEKYIEDNPDYYQEEKLAVFQLKKMTACLHLQDFKNGRIHVEKSLQTFPEGSALWFHFMEYYLLLALHTENFINAMAIFNRAVNHSKFKKQDIIIREKWKVFEVYMNYFFESQADTVEVLKAQSKSSFRVSRLLNDPVIYPKDQRAFSIHMVIAQFLFHLQRGDHTAATEKVDRLRNYANKKLDKTDHARMINFIRLLQQLVRSNFTVSMITGTDKYLKRLNEQPFFYRGLLHELEIVPFDQLWGFLLAKLEKEEKEVVYY